MLGHPERKGKLRYIGVNERIIFRKKRQDVRLWNSFTCA
jgi:hypothetical protein